MNYIKHSKVKVLKEWNIPFNHEYTHVTNQRLTKLAMKVIDDVNKQKKYLKKLDIVKRYYRAFFKMHFADTYKELNLHDPNTSNLVKYFPYSNMKIVTKKVANLLFEEAREEIFKEKNKIKKIKENIKKVA